MQLLKYITYVKYVCTLLLLCNKKGDEQTNGLKQTLRLDFLIPSFNNLVQDFRRTFSQWICHYFQLITSKWVPKLVQMCQKLSKLNQYICIPKLSNFCQIPEHMRRKISQFFAIWGSTLDLDIVDRNMQLKSLLQWTKICYQFQSCQVKFLDIVDFLEIYSGPFFSD